LSLKGWKGLQNQSHQKEVRMAKVILKGLVPDDSPIYQQALQIGGRLTVPTQKAVKPVEPIFTEELVVSVPTTKLNKRKKGPKP